MKAAGVEIKDGALAMQEPEEATATDMAEALEGITHAGEEKWTTDKLKTFYDAYTNGK